MEREMANIIVALANAPWEQQFISQLGHPMLGISISKRCVDGVDLQATVRSHDVDAVVVTDGVLRVDSNCVADILASGIRFIAITENHMSWYEFGVIDTIDLAEADIPAMVSSFMTLVRELPQDAIPEAQANGKLIAVTGFGGASGRSTCAFHLAQQLASASTTCLVDADVYAPSLAQEVGQTELSGGLLGLARTAELRKLNDLSLHENSMSLENGLAFVRGLPNPQRWTDLRLHALKSMWSYLTSMANFTVVDCGPAYEVTDQLSDITSKPIRGISFLTALDAADTIVLTSNATDVGIARLINGFNDVHELIADKELIVTIYGVSDEKLERELRLVIARELGVTAIVCLDGVSGYDRLAGLITNLPVIETKTARRGIIRKRAA